MALDLTDYSSNSNNLTNDGVTEVTSGLPFANATNAADFERGGNDHFSCSDSSSLDILADLSFMTWAKFESVPSNGQYYYYFAKVNASQASYRMYQWNDGTAKITFSYTPNNSAYDFLTVNWSPSTGTWYHVAVTYDASESETRFYIDGTQQGSTQTGSHNSIYNSNADFEIGVQYNVNGFDGVMKDVRLYDVVKSQTDIDNEKDDFAPNYATDTNLKGYWPFEEPTAPPASSSISKVAGVAQASISKVAGVAEASISKIAGVDNTA